MTSVDHSDDETWLPSVKDKIIKRKDAEIERLQSAVAEHPPIRTVVFVCFCGGLLLGTILTEGRQYVANRLAPGRVQIHCMDLGGGSLF